MSYIGNQPYQVAFVSDSFSGTGSTTVFTMSVAPAGTTNVLVVVSGVVQDPATYGVVGTTLNFTTAPPSGTANISVRYLGIPVTGVTTTAYRTKTEFTATAGQTTFTPPSYTVGYIDVFRNGVLLGSADYTASNGTTVVLATGATSGDLITTESFYVSSVLNAIPNSPASVGSSNIVAGVTLTSPTIAGNGITFPTGGNPQAAPASVIQVVSVSNSTSQSTTNTSFTNTSLAASITPKFSTSKILIIVNFAGYDVGGGGVNWFATIQRGTTNLGSATYGFGTIYQASSGLQGAFGISYLDSPATTSSTTYSFAYAKSGGTAYLNFNGETSTITVMEIAA